MASLDLGKQVGPLPLGAWVAVVAGGVGIAWYTRNRTADTPIEDTSGGAVPGVGDGSVGGWSPTTPTTGDSGSTDNPVIQTNEAWAVAAIKWLIAQGYDATESDSAIRKYINATGTKSVKEWALINLALVHYGPPPNPLPPDEQDPPSSAPPPVTQPPPAQNPPPAPPPAQVHWYTVSRGDNLWNIAKKYYGNGAQYVRIFNANRSGVRRPDGSMGMVSNPNLIQPGWRLYIP